MDVSELSIARAKKFSERCQVYDGKRLPFSDNYFDSAGALNVLEHVDEPEAFIQEVVRVVAPGGKVVISSPNFMRAIGLRALNVLEHVDEPEAFIQEVVRVVAPGGKVVISSPNFMRAIGLRDYHPKMRGLSNKWRNWRRIGQKRALMRTDPSRVKFDRMVPIVKQPFEPTMTPSSRRTD